MPPIIPQHKIVKLTNLDNIDLFKIISLVAQIRIKMKVKKSNISLRIEEKLIILYSSKAIPVINKIRIMFKNLLIK